MSRPSFLVGRERLLARISVGLIVVGGVVAAAKSGLLEFVGDEDELADFFRDNGVIGPLAFIAAFWTLQPFGGIPGIAFVIPAAAVWSPPMAFGLSYVGVMGASTIAFLAARFVLRDWVRARMPDRIQDWENRLTVAGVKGVIVFRLGTFMVSPADWLLGVSAVTFRQFFVGTAVGMVPVCGVMVLTGGGIVEGWQAMPAALRVAAVVALVVLVVIRRLRLRSATTATPAS